MKEYKYKINGNNYNVAIGDIVDSKAEVLVNGTPYKVELDQKKAPVTVVSQTPRSGSSPHRSRRQGNSKTQRSCRRHSD